MQNRLLSSSAIDGAGAACADDGAGAAEEVAVPGLCCIAASPAEPEVIAAVGTDDSDDSDDEDEAGMGSTGVSMPRRVGVSSRLEAWNEVLEDDWRSRLGSLSTSQL